MLMLMGVSLLSALLVGLVAYRSGHAGLTASVFDKLTGLRAAKANQIESYLDRVDAHVRTLGEDKMIASAMVRFRDAFESLAGQSIPPQWDDNLDAYYRDEFLPRLQENVEGLAVFESYRPARPSTRYLQYQYISSNPNDFGEKQGLSDAGDGSSYSAVHAEFHPILRNLADEFGYYDMFLVDAESGAVVYSVYKETDFATSLRDGPYSNTNFAAVVQRVRETPDKGFVAMIDFAPYRPSYSAPAAFIATPIYNGSKALGILAFQLPVDEINRIMTGNQNWAADGLGESGETYLVGPDFLMRSISRFLVQDPAGYAQSLRASGVPAAEVERTLRLGTSILQQEVRTEAASQAMQNRSGTRVVDDYRGIPVLSSFAPLDIADVSWVILSEIDVAEAFAPIDTFAREMILAAVILIVVMTVLAMLLAASFVRPIQAVADGARRVGAGETDLRIASGTRDEVGDLAQAFNEMVENVGVQHTLIQAKNRENEQLLLNILPPAIAERLRAGEEPIADAHENVTVLFSDLEGFAALSRELPARDSVTLLNELISTFDETAEQHGVEKIKSIGDGYMTACGLSSARLDHAKRTADFALELFSILRRFNNERGLSLELRVGIHAGPIVAGVIGRNKFLYDLWGDTVHVAHRMKERAKPGEVRVSPVVAEALEGLYILAPAAREGGEDSFVLQSPRDTGAPEQSA
jgi:class 3 adenylate cyclase